MKENRITRAELAINVIEPLHGRGDTLRVGSGLVANAAVVHAAHVVRPFEHLKAPVGAGGPVDGHHAARELGKQTAIVVPVPIVLVPLPGAPLARLFKDHLVMIMVNLAPQQLFHPVNDAVAAHKRTFDIAAKVVVHRQPDDPTLPIATSRGLTDTFTIGPRDLAEKINLI